MDWNYDSDLYNRDLKGLHMRKRVLSIFLIYSFVLTSVFASSASFNLLFDKVETAEIGFYSDAAMTTEIQSIDFMLDSTVVDGRTKFTTPSFYIGWNVSGNGTYTLTAYSDSEAAKELESNELGCSLSDINSGENKMNFKLESNELKIQDTGEFTVDDYQKEIAGSKRTYSSTITVNGSESKSSESSLVVETDEAFLTGPFRGYILLVLSKV